ncbi:MAG TPA: hypothetical protein VH277_03125 [Gemmatimonadaceae bacterium]|nr:hypothetical protein [Gemmatimonadaceae bacterium]
MRLLHLLMLTSAAALHSATVQLPGREPPGRALPGYAYTVRIAARPVAHGNASVPPAMDAQSFTGHAVVAAGRGRLDIVEGGAEGMFQKGDYLLFDSSDVVIVHPATKEFVAVARDGTSGALQQLDALGARLTLSEEKVTLDSLGGGDTVSGVPTRRYRMTVAFNMALDAGVTQQRLATESTTEYWIASIPDMPPNPLLRVNGLAGGMGGAPMFGTIAARVDSVAARMGTAIALRTRGTTHVLLGPGATLETEQNSEVTDLRRTQIDASVLMISPNFKLTPPPGGEINASATDAARKWLSMPAR